MILALAAGLVLFAAGVAVGRVKNAAKLAAAKAELDKIEASAAGVFGSALAEAKSVFAALRAKL